MNFLGGVADNIFQSLHINIFKKVLIEFIGFQVFLEDELLKHSALDTPLLGIFRLEVKVYHELLGPNVVISEKNISRLVSIFLVSTINYDRILITVPQSFLIFMEILVIRIEVKMVFRCI